jgi:2-dehydropantoate 2-reductase
MHPSTQYAVVGAGGIGCAVGYALCAAGVSVTFVDTDLNKVAWGQSNGVRVDDLPSQPATFVPFDDWNPAGDARVLLCTKCYDNATVLSRIPRETVIIPIQNGFDRSFNSFDAFAEGIASFVSECIPGRSHTRITRRGELHLGAHFSRTNETGLTKAHAIAVDLAKALADSPLFHVELVADILPFKHSKLMYNAAIGPLAAALGVENGALLSVPKARKLFFGLLRENFNILDGAGLSLGTIGPFHPRTVDWILRKTPVAWALSWVFYPTLKGTYCSMHGDLPKGRTEIEYYNRYLIDVAGNRPCPLNRVIYDQITKMEREKATPGLHILDRIQLEHSLA